MLELPVTEWQPISNVIPAPTGLDDAGIAAVRQHVYRLYNYNVCMDVTQEFRDGWPFSAANGTIAKRIKNLIYKKHGHEIAKELLETIATEVNRCKTLQGEYRITDKLDWQAGDYADKYSCFWEFNSRYLALLVMDKCGAVLVRNDKKGLGRAFLAKTKGGLLLFNNTGIPKEWLESIVKASLPDPAAVRTEMGTPFHLIAKMAGGNDNGFYTNGGHIRFYVNEERGPMQKTLPACHCFLRFSGRKAEAKDAPRCDNCPFTEAHLSDRDRIRVRNDYGQYT